MIRRIRAIRTKTRPIFRRRTAPAAPPGTVTSAAEKTETKIREIYFDQDQLIEQELTEPFPFQMIDNKTGVLWIDIIGVGNGEIVEEVGRRFNLHPLTLEDVVHTHQRSKCEDYKDRIYFVARMLNSEDGLESEQVSLFLGPNFVISFQERRGDCFEPIRERIRQRARIRYRPADYLFYALIDAIIDGYFPKLESYANRLDLLEEKILQNQGEVEEVYAIRSELMRLRKHVWQHREAVYTLVRQEHELVSEETRIFMRDCYDHTIQLIDVAETLRDQCTNLRDLHLSQLSTRQNDVMKTLTIFATIFMPMSFVAGVYGMNFDHGVSNWNMPETEWRYGYPFALSVMAAIGIGLVVYFWRKGWMRD